MRSDPAGDRARLRAAEAVVYGGDLGRARRQGWYAIYLFALVAGTYGFPIAQATLRSADPAALRAVLLTPLAASVAALAVAALVALMSRVGRVRGPVLPTLPYLEFVVGSSIRRSVTLRRSWRAAVTMTVAVGVIVALVGAGSLAYASAVPAWWLAPAAALGAVAGAAVGRAWLWGQVRAGDGPAGRRRPEPRLARCLDALAYPVLREQVASSASLTGALLTADLRSVRLLVGAPITRARQVRLRSGAGVATLVRRDLLGLRRMPFSTVVGMALTAVAAAGQTLAWSRSASAPLAVALLAGWLGYLGVAALAEGARVQADNAWAPRLLGLAPRVEAVAHLVAPALIAGAVALAVALPVAWSSGTGATGLAGALTSVGLAVTSVLAAAFRGLPAVGPVLTQGRLALMVWRVIAPGALCIVAIGVSAQRVRLGDTTGWLTAAMLAGALAMWGLSRVDAAHHRTG